MSTSSITAAITTAASVASGRLSNRPVSRTSVITVSKATTSPDTWLLAPAPPLTAVLDRLPLTTMPLARAEPRLAAPRPTISRFAAIVEIFDPSGVDIVGHIDNSSLSKTAVNGGAGANSQVSGLVVAVLTVITLVLLTGLFESLPEATLAAVVIAAVIELVDIPALVRLYRVWTTRLGRIYGPAARADFIAALTAMLGVLVFDTLPGLFIGISTSLVLLLYRASRPNVAELGRLPSGEWVDRARSDDAAAEPGVTVRVEAGLFFANSDHVRQTVLAHAREEGVHAVILDAETIAFIDVSAAEMLHALAGELERDGVELLVARDVGQVRDILRDEGGDQRLFPSVEAAVTQAR